MVQRTPLSRDGASSSLHTVARSRPQVDRGRLGVYAALGASIGAVPIPWLPDALVRRVRGALLHHVAARHGLSLTPDARTVLAEPSGPDGPRGLSAQVLRFLGAKVALRMLAGVGPVSVVWPLRNALRMYVLGHLFDRYLELSRTERAVRIDVEEARRVRVAIDSALLRALTVVTPPMQEPTTVDDQREPSTVFADAVLGLAAGLPSRLMNRLDASFDELLTHANG
jgi:hypothetical protein